MDQITKNAYAKINLYLDVASRYSDGYHEVHTVMQSVSLFDEVEILLDGEGIDIFCDEPSVPTDKGNIVWRATELFLAEIGESNHRGVKINITKRIPVSAGLGGGSADAAAVLCGLNELFGASLPRERLLSLGALLGADVPFCMTGGTSYADGKGDKLHELSPMPECSFVIARGGEGVSTPWAYGALDRSFNNFRDGFYMPRNIGPFENALNNKDIYGISRNLYNIFEEAVFFKRPVARQLKELMLEEGSLGAIMSGSGTAVFGIFDNEQKAKKVVKKINKLGYFSCLATTVKKYF